MLEVMRHLSTSDPAWIVQVETPAVVSYFELATGVLNGAIIREQAVRAARERGGAECDVRKMLNWAEAVMDHEAESALRRGCSPAGSRKRRASR
jgi:hypothetical protein